MLSEYLDGDLDLEMDREVSVHLESCRECHEYLNSLKLVSSSLEIFLDESPPPVPENFTEKIKAAAESDISDIRTGNERLWGLGISAGLLVVVALIVASNLGYSNSYVQSAMELPVLAVNFITDGLHKISVTASVICGTMLNQLLFKSILPAIGVIVILTLSLFVFSKHLRSIKRS